MRIHHLEFPVPDVSASATFFADVLGLPVTRGLVRIGWTGLLLVPAADAVPATQHLAITVPGDADDAAHDWLAGRVSLLGLNGEDRFEASRPGTPGPAASSGPAGRCSSSSPGAGSPGGWVASGSGRSTSWG